MKQNELLPNRNLIIFDLDDTLVNSTKAYSLALSAIGVSPSDSTFQRSRELVKLALGEGHPNARNRLLYLKNFLDLQGRFSPLALLKLMDHYEAVLQDFLRSQWLELRRDTLFDELVSEGYRLVVLTNENLRTQLIKMKAIDPDAKYFERILTSEEVGVEKPNRKMLESILALSGVTNEKAIIVGDSITNDIMPGLELGLRTFLTREFSADSSEEIIPGAGTSIAKLDDLRKHLL